MSRTVPSNCLGQTSTTRCVTWDGQAYPDLDIKKGDSLEWVLDRIVANLNGDDVDAPTVDIACLATGGVSECGAQISYRLVRITTSQSTGGVHIDWNGDAIQAALPAEYSIIGAQIAIRSGDGTSLYTGSSFTAGVTIQLSAFPVTMDYIVIINTPCGQIRLVGYITISANPGIMNYGLSLVDVPTATSTVDSIVGAIELMAREICALKNQI